MRLYTRILLVTVFLSILTISSYINPSLSNFYGSINQNSKINSKATGNLSITSTDFTATNGWTHSNTIGKSQLIRLATYNIINGLWVSPSGSDCMPNPATNDPSTNSYQRLISNDEEVWHTWENTDWVVAWMRAYFANPMGTRRYWEVDFYNDVKCWSNWNEPGHISVTQVTSQPQRSGNTYTQAVTTISRTAGYTLYKSPTWCATSDPVHFNPDNNILGDFWADSIQSILWRYQYDWFDDTDWWWDYSKLAFTWVEFYQTGTATSPIYELGDSDHLYKTLHDITFQGAANGGTINLYYKVLSPSGTWSATWQPATGGSPISDVLASDIQIQFTLTPEPTLKQQSPQITSLTINYGDPPDTHEPYFGDIDQTPLATNVNYDNTVAITCRIDSGASALQTAILEYSTDSSFTSYTTINMNGPFSSGPGTYSATIPVFNMVGTTVYYRIHTINAYGDVRSAISSYTIIDNVPPVIDTTNQVVQLIDTDGNTITTWTSPNLPTLTASIIVECPVTDARSSVSSVTLLVKQSGVKNAQVVAPTTYTSYSMTYNGVTSRWTYQFDVEITIGTIEYKFQASDSASNSIISAAFQLTKSHPYIEGLTYTFNPVYGVGLEYGAPNSVTVRVRNPSSNQITVKLDFKPSLHLGTWKIDNYPTITKTLTIPRNSYLDQQIDFSFGWSSDSGNNRYGWEWFTFTADWSKIIATINPPAAATPATPEEKSRKDILLIQSVNMPVLFDYLLYSLSGEEFDEVQDSKTLNVPEEKWESLANAMTHYSNYQWDIFFAAALNIIGIPVALVPYIGPILAGACEVLGVVAWVDSAVQSDECWVDVALAEDPPSYDYQEVFLPENVETPSIPTVTLPELTILGNYIELSVEIYKYQIAFFETINRWHGAYLDNAITFQELQVNALNLYRTELINKIELRKQLIEQVPVEISQQLSEEILNFQIWEALPSTQMELKENATFFNIVFNRFKEVLIPLGYSEEDVYYQLLEAINFVPENTNEAFIDLLQPEGDLFKVPYTSTELIINQITEETQTLTSITQNPQNYYQSSCLTIEPSKIQIIPGDMLTILIQIANPTDHSVTFNIEIDQRDLPGILTPINLQISVPSLQLSEELIEFTVPRQSSIFPMSSYITVTAISLEDPALSFSSSVPIEILPYHEGTGSITPQDQTIFDNQIATYEITLQNLGNAPEMYSLEINGLTLGDSCFKVEGTLLINNEILINPEEVKIISLEISPLLIGVETFTISINSIVLLPEIGATVMIIDDDNTAPLISISYTGTETDGDSGAWAVSVADPESGISTISIEIDGLFVGSSNGNYQAPNSLGTHSILVTATNADLDREASDQESATVQGSIIIVDDDITPPEISNLEINVGISEIIVSLTAQDVSGIGGFEFHLNGELITPISQDSVGNIYSFIFLIDGLIVFGINELLITVWDADIDRLEDGLSSTISGTFETITGTIEKLIQMVYDSAVSAWSDPAENRKNAMLNKLDETILLYQAKEYAQCYDKLLHDIKPKLTGLKVDEEGNIFGDGTFKNSWVIDSTLQQNFAETINLILSALKSQ